MSLIEKIKTSKLLDRDRTPEHPARATPPQPDEGDKGRP